MRCLKTLFLGLALSVGCSPVDPTGVWLVTPLTFAPNTSSTCFTDILPTHNKITFLISSTEYQGDDIFTYAIEVEDIPQVVSLAGDDCDSNNCVLTAIFGTSQTETSAEYMVALTTDGDTLLATGDYRFTAAISGSEYLCTWSFNGSGAKQ